MIQFLRFATSDGFALVKLEDISSLASTDMDNVCRVTTRHADFLVTGSFDDFAETLAGIVGGDISTVKNTTGEEVTSG